MRELIEVTKAALDRIDELMSNNKVPLSEMKHFDRDNAEMILQKAIVKDQKSHSYLKDILKEYLHVEVEDDSISPDEIEMKVTLYFDQDELSSDKCVIQLDKD